MARKMTANDMLDDLAGSKKTTKSKTPIQRISSPKQIKQLLAVRDGKNDLKAAKSKLDLAQGNARPWANEGYEAQCLKDGTLHTSIKYTDGDEGNITYTQVAKVKASSMKQEDAQPVLERIFDDEYDTYFACKQSLSIDISKLENDVTLAILKAIKAAIGKEEFAAMQETGAISAELLVGANEAFFRDRILNADVKRKAKQAESEGIAVMQAASFKA